MAGGIFFTGRTGKGVLCPFCARRGVRFSHMTNRETEEIKTAIAAEMEQFAAEYIAGRVDFLRKKKIEASGALASSLAYELNRQARAEAVELLLAFEESGRFIDMKRLRPSEGGGNYIAALEAWISHKGLADRFTRKFMDKYGLNKPPANVLNKIAWGIATVRGGGKVRRRAWYSKSRAGAVSDLYNRVAAMLPEFVGRQIAQKITTQNP